MNSFQSELKHVLGLELRKARKAKKLSLRSLSDAVGNQPTKSSIVRYESGENLPDDDTLSRLCNVLGLSMVDLYSYASMQACLAMADNESHENDN